MTFVALWARRLWPYLLILLCCAAAGALAAHFVLTHALSVAHERTAVATKEAAHQDTIFRTDTLERRIAVVQYRAVRDSALRNLADSFAVKRTFAAADTEIARSDASLEQAARAIQAHVILESALRTELALCERRRSPRFRVSSEGGFDIDGQTPVTGAELEVRVSDRWSIVGRLDKRWAPGEGNRRQLLLRYSLGR